MFALLAVLPIILAIVMMMFLKAKASTSLLAAWALASILAMAFWRMNIADVAGFTLSGFLSAIDVIFIIFAAIFLLNVLLQLRFIETIGNSFASITQDRRIQILIIGWLFGAFIEGAAGFGTPAALAAPLLIGLGIPAGFAALAALIANSTPVLFGAVGTPTSAGFATINPGITYEFGAQTAATVFSQLNWGVSLINMLPGIFVPFMMIAFIVMRDGRKRGIKDALNILPLAMFAGLVFVVPAFLASLLGPQLPTLTGALVGLAIFIFAVKRGFLVPKEVYRFQDDPIIETTEVQSTGISTLTAWAPYAIIAGLLVLTRLPWLPIVNWIRSAAATISIHNILGIPGINWNWAPLNNPGLLPMLPVAIAFLLLRRASREDVKEIALKTFNQVKAATLALLFGVALVQIMRFTDFSLTAGALGTGDLGSMTHEIAAALATLAGPLYPLFAPIIGIVGAFVSGSHTVSNIMFYGLQMETARQLGLPIVLMLIAQTSGGAIGNMIALNNVLAVAATTNAQGQESNLIKQALVPCLIYSLVISAILFVLIGIGVSWVL